MTEKEKAEEMQGKFIYEIGKYDARTKGEKYPIEALKTSKQCALICIDEIIEAVILSRRCFSGGSEMSDTQLKFWREVKQEIEKL